MAKKPTAEFTPIFVKLKAILTPYAKKMKVVKDDAQWYYLDTNSIGANKKPIGFAAVRIGQNYVSFYLMPIYMNLKLQATISPELKKRQQGKACFNFAEVDGKLFAELKSLTKAGAECFKKLGYE
jgi:hypothetical protein